MSLLFDLGNLTNIPQEMKEYRQWICWKNVQVSGNSAIGKRKAKMPIDPCTTIAANVSDMSTWGTLDQAIEAIKKDTTSELGLGFVFTADDPFCFIDFDDPHKLVPGGMSPATINKDVIGKRNLIISRQVDLVTKLDSYSEISPSGTGLHTYCKINKGLLPTLLGRRSNYAEIYLDRRFATITGIPYRAGGVEYRHSVVDGVLSEFEAAVSSPSSSTVTGFNATQIYSDDDILRFASTASNGDKFNKLWEGDIHTYHQGDHSRADFALIDILAFYTQNIEQITRLFRGSSLGQRDKANRDDYVLGMIRKAISDKVPVVDIDLAFLENELTKAMGGSGIARNAGPGSNVGLGISSNLELGETFARAATIKEKIEKIGSHYNRLGQEIPQDITISLEEISEPPGILNDISTFLYRASRKPVPQIALVGAIGFMAGIVGRPFNVFGKGLNLYLLMQAKTGRGKEAIAEGHNKLYGACNRENMPQINDFRGPGDLASGQGLLRYLSDSRLKSCCAVFGEFGKTLKRITSDKASAADLMIQKVLLDVYGKSGRDSIIEPTQYSDAERNTQPIQSPAFSIIGETTPKWLSENFAYGMIDSGLLPRFITVNYDGERVPSNDGHHLVSPDDRMIKMICAIAHQSLTYIASGVFFEIAFTQKALDMSKRLDRFCDLRINLSGADASGEIWNRVHLNTAKVAAIIAVGINFLKPVIDEICWEWAEKFVIFCAMQMETKFESGDVVATDDPLIHQRILERLIGIYLKAGTEQTGFLQIQADERLVKAKVVSYKWLGVKVSNISAFRQAVGGPNRILKIAIEQMIDNGDLIEVPRSQAITNFGSQGKMYMPTSDMVKRLLKPE